MLQFQERPWSRLLKMLQKDLLQTRNPVWRTLPWHCSPKYRCSLISQIVRLNMVRCSSLWLLVTLFVSYAKKKELRSWSVRSANTRSVLPTSQKAFCATSTSGTHHSGLNRNFTAINATNTSVKERKRSMSGRKSVKNANILVVSSFSQSTTLNSAKLNDPGKWYYLRTNLSVWGVRDKVL